MTTSIRQMLALTNGRVRICEAHDNVSKELIRDMTGRDGNSFHGMWISGLTQTTYLGIPDTELISPLKRASKITFNDDPSQPPSFPVKRPLCAAYDADSGGDLADIPALVSLLLGIGVTMIVIEDKFVGQPGQKVNSLAGSSAKQAQEDPHVFAETIRAFRRASKDTEMMITARIESFTTRVVRTDDEAEEVASVQATLDDALHRAAVYTEAGADAIMIHSKSKMADEVMSFLAQFRLRDAHTPLVVVPTTYAQTTENTLYAAGANVVIYANHLMRAKINAIDDVSAEFVSAKPDIFQHDAELFRTCFEARNFGCLLQMMDDQSRRGSLSDEAQQYRVAAERRASDTMAEVVTTLLEGRRAGVADKHLITVKDLLKINSQQVCSIA